MEGGVSMQPDPESGKPVGNEHSLQGAKPANKNEGFFRRDHMGGPEGMPYLQELQFQNQPRRRKPSLPIWRLVLMIGDSGFVLRLLLLIINPAPDLALTS